MIPELSTLFLFPCPLAVNLEFVTVAEFLPSITTICEPLALPVVLEMEILPVE